MLIICILILVAMIQGKSIEPLLEKIKNIDWKGYCNKAWEKIKEYSKQIGRSTCEKCLTAWYVLDDANTSTLDKALIYGAIIYTVSPWSIIPSVKFRVLGLLDEVIAINFVINRIRKNITLDIENKVKNTLEEWFGPEHTLAESEA